MKRMVLLLMCVALVLVSSSCAEESVPVQYARSCYEMITSDVDGVDRIHFMQYTSKDDLNDNISETAGYSSIPDSGYVILFDYVGAVGVFMDTYAFFLDASGDIAYKFDYEENFKLSKEYIENSSDSLSGIANMELATGYLRDCNCIAEMLTYAIKNSKAMEDECTIDVWYSFSDDQIEKVIG